MKVRPTSVGSGTPGWVDIVYPLYVITDNGDGTEDYDPTDFTAEEAKLIHENAHDTLERLERARIIIGWLINARTEDATQYATIKALAFLGDKG